MGQVMRYMQRGHRLPHNSVSPMWKDPPFRLHRNWLALHVQVDLKFFQSISTIRTHSSLYVQNLHCRELKRCCHNHTIALQFKFKYKIQFYYQMDQVYGIEITLCWCAYTLQVFVNGVGMARDGPCLLEATSLGRDFKNLPHCLPHENKLEFYLWST